MNSIARERIEVEKKGFLRPYEWRFLLLAAGVGVAWGVVARFFYPLPFNERSTMAMQVVTLPAQLSTSVIPLPTSFRANFIDHWASLGVILIIGAILLLIPTGAYIGIRCWKSS